MPQISPTGPIQPRAAVLWHGADYNPDQWPPETLDEDVQLMRQAGVNAVSLGIFSWAQLETAPGRFDFDWMDRAFEKLWAGGVHVALATPTAAPPRWMTAAEPQVLAVSASGTRLPHGGRQRFCPTSPAYRRHVERINTALAQRYGGHPALMLWHISNEYVSNCHCPLCAEAFIGYLKQRYGDLATLNAQWWAAFWSQRFAAWEQVEPPRPAHGTVPHGLTLDWQRFRSHQMCEFFKFEAATVRAVTPEVPITTNMMGKFPGLDYAAFAEVMDVVSWDCYGSVGADPVHMAFDHSLMRGMKDNRPWLLIEQTPSATNWQEYGTLKPPGVLRLWSLQAIGHGSDSAMYFQWRRSRGASEKFHGAVVEHAAGSRARVFGEVAALGAELKQLSPIVIGTAVTPARIGILCDQESRWAFENAAGYARDKRYLGELQRHFRAVWTQNLRIDVVQHHRDWSGYDILIAPRLYMLKSGLFPREGTPEQLAARVDVAAKLAAFVERGGTLVVGCLSGIVNESDLVYEGGYPGPLRQLLGIWVEQTDCLPPSAPGSFANGMSLDRDVLALPSVSCGCDRFFDRVHLRGATAAAAYTGNWYAGEPCLTVHRHGHGEAWYIATDPEAAFLEQFYRHLAARHGLHPTIEPVAEVEVLTRRGGGREVLFILNHAPEPRSVAIAPNADAAAADAPGASTAAWHDAHTDTVWPQRLELAPLQVRIAQRRLDRTTG